MNETTKHTPGPWMTLYNSDGTTIFSDASDQDIALVYDMGSTDEEETQADGNVLVIAAAPDMLTALQFALDSEDVTLGDGGSILGKEIREYIEQAISKAKGE